MVIYLGHRLLVCLDPGSRPKVATGHCAEERVDPRNQGYSHTPKPSLHHHEFTSLRQGYGRQADRSLVADALGSRGVSFPYLVIRCGRWSGTGFVSVALVLLHVYLIYRTATGVTRMAFR